MTSISHHSERLFYRGWDDALDTESLWQDFQDPESVAQLSADATPYTQDRIKAYVETMKKRKLFMVVCTPPDAEHPRGRRIGHFSLKTEFNDATLAIGILMSKSERGKGYGKEALLFLMHAAFHWFGAHRLQLGVFSYNTTAKKLYESVGFVIDGQMREVFWFLGKYQDAFEMSILDREYHAKYPEKGGA